MGRDWTAPYHGWWTHAPNSCRAALINGEVIVQDENGISDFDALHSAIYKAPHWIVFFAFDLLHLDGQDLKRSQLIDRRAALRKLIEPDLRSRFSSPSPSQKYTDPQPEAQINGGKSWSEAPPTLRLDKCATGHPYAIQLDGNPMEAKVRPGDTEKITINLGYIDLGTIDLLVKEGFYSNRTDLIRTAIRNQLSAHADVVKKMVVRQTLELGLRHYDRKDLEAVKAAGEMLRIKVLGLASIAPDVSPALALATIELITVLGVLHASEKVKTALADRIR